MATKYIVDTHALIWFLEGNPALGNEVAAVFSDLDSHLILPVIALAEAIYIVDKGRTSIPSVGDLLDDVNADPRIEIYPLDTEVLLNSLDLSNIPEMHDRLIVATGVLLRLSNDDVRILTRDNEIVSSSILPVVW